MRNDIKKNKKGFSMLEMVFVLGLFSMGVVGIASLMLQNMQAGSVNMGYLKASLLAQEGLEIVRATRDDNWLLLRLDPTLTAEDIPWDQDIGTADTDGTFTVSYNGIINDVPDDIDDAGTVLNFHNNFFEHENGSPTNFRRLITVADCGTECLNVKSEVAWKASGKSHSYIAETILYNWR